MVSSEIQMSAWHRPHSQGSWGNIHSDETCRWAYATLGLQTYRNCVKRLDHFAWRALFFRMQDLMDEVEYLKAIHAADPNRIRPVIVLDLIHTPCTRWNWSHFLGEFSFFQDLLHSTSCSCRCLCQLYLVSQTETHSQDLHISGCPLNDIIVNFKFSTKKLNYN